jgi:hypothetical protein
MLPQLPHLLLTVRAGLLAEAGSTVVDEVGENSNEADSEILGCGG